MRSGIVLAVAALTVALGEPARGPTNGAAMPRHKDAVVQCGYTTAIRLRNRGRQRAACVSSIPTSRSNTKRWRADEAADEDSRRAAEPDDGRDRQRQVFIESKNSPLFLVLRSLSSRKSMASMVPIGLRMRRSTYIFLS